MAQPCGVFVIWCGAFAIRSRALLVHRMIRRSSTAHAWPSSDLPSLQFSTHSYCFMHSSCLSTTPDQWLPRKLSSRPSFGPCFPSSVPFVKPSENTRNHNLPNCCTKSSSLLCNPGLGFDQIVLGISTRNQLFHRWNTCDACSASI